VTLGSSHHVLSSRTTRVDDEDPTWLRRPFLSCFFSLFYFHYFDIWTCFGKIIDVIIYSIN